MCECAYANIYTYAMRVYPRRRVHEVQYDQIRFRVLGVLVSGFHPKP